jgi:hypothetical protein
MKGVSVGYLVLSAQRKAASNWTWLVNFCRESIARVSLFFASHDLLTSQGFTVEIETVRLEPCTRIS